AVFERIGKAVPVQVVGGLSIAQAKSLAKAGLRAFVISGNMGLPDGNARYNLPPAEIQRLVAGFIAGRSGGECGHSQTDPRRRFYDGHSSDRRCESRLVSRQSRILAHPDSGFMPRLTSAPFPCGVSRRNSAREPCMADSPEYRRPDAQTVPES